MTTFCECDACKKVKKHWTKRGTDIMAEAVGGMVPQKTEVDAALKNLNETIRKKETEVTNGYLEKLKADSEYYIDIANGKYTIYQEKQGSLKALRYGEPWQDLCGNNMVFNLMIELIEAKDTIKSALDDILEIDDIDTNDRAYHINILKGDWK